jgi:ABC-type thiamine transport system substrate-binding protein
LITRVYRELKKQQKTTTKTPRKINDPMKKWANEVNTNISK